MPRRVLHDRYFRQAKDEGYLARSAYKLQEIQERKRLIRRGDRVLDLGCAPGGWLQVASGLVGPDGVIVGLDLRTVAHAIAPNVITHVGDIDKIDPATLLGEPPRLFDVVLSDMAPHTTGHGDDLVSARLCDRVLELLPALLKPTGNLAMKILEGGETPRLLKEMKQTFGKAGAYKPRASRDISREIYLIGIGFAGGR